MQVSGEEVTRLLPLDGVICRSPSAFEIDAGQSITVVGGAMGAAMQLCGSLSSADKALECTKTFLRRSVRNPVPRQDPLPAREFN